MVRFKGKVALVTGGSEGMGGAIAQGLAKEGAKLALLDVQEEKGKKFVAELANGGVQASFYKVDVTKKPGVDAAVAAAEKNFGRIDILVNVVGGHWPGPFTQSDEENWDKVIALNYKSILYTMKAVVDGMVARKYGKIVNIASDAGRIGTSNQALYSGAKGGVIALSRALAHELGGHGINVNTVSPGLINTPSFKARAGDHVDLVEQLKKTIVMGRLGKPEDIAAAVLFLASDEASYITGQVLSVNGGMSML